MATLGALASVYVCIHTHIIECAFHSHQIFHTKCAKLGTVLEVVLTATNTSTTTVGLVQYNIAVSSDKLC